MNWMKCTVRTPVIHPIPVKVQRNQPVVNVIFRKGRNTLDYARQSVCLSNQPQQSNLFILIVVLMVNSQQLLFIIVEISAPTSDDFLGCYSSPNSSLQSICGYTLNSVTKSRRYGRRYDPSVLSDMIRDPSYLSCSSIEGFRQQSEPALLHPEDKVSPALLRSGSQPALTSSQELPVLSLLQLNHCVPVERVDEPSQSTVSKSPQSID